MEPRSIALLTFIASLEHVERRRPVLGCLSSRSGRQLCGHETALFELTQDVGKYNTS